MTRAAKIARDETITDALRAINDAIGNDEPTDQALAIIAAVKSMREEKVRIVGGNVDYLKRVQDKAQSEYRQEHGSGAMPIGDEYFSVAAVDTPLGRLSCRSWRTVWKGDRLAWASEYELSGEAITVREIKAAGLAQRPTTRNRQKKEPRN